MPSRLDTTVLSLDINNIKKMDTSTENLFGMWTIFSKCAESLENGRRLENLSWRLWNRETYCCIPEEGNTSTQIPPVDVSEKPAENTISEEVPDLSASVDSISSESERLVNRSSSTDNCSRPEYLRRDSVERIRGKEKHVTPTHLAQLMINLNKDSIQDAEHELHLKRSSPKNIQNNSKTTYDRSNTSSNEQKMSVTSVDSTFSTTSNTSSHSIVRGFTPGVASISYRSSTNLALPALPIRVEEGKIPVPVAGTNKKKHKMFTIGSSASDDSNSLQSSFGSALTSGLKRAGSSGGSKRTAFDGEVTTRTVYSEDEDDFSDDEDDEDDNISESAIEDDDDSSDWDSVTESGQSSYSNDNMFARIEDPRPVLTTRRSLLSTLLHQPDRAAALAKAGSRSMPVMRSRASTPVGPSMPPSPSQDSPINTITQVQPRPIIIPASNPHPPALSPRTTRRNMLATELTESLRKHMLWERQQRNQTATAALKRRHTTQDLTNMSDDAAAQLAARNKSYQQFFEKGVHDYWAGAW